MAESDPRAEILNRLAEEFATRLRQGDTPPVDELAERHPELAEEIRALFPTLRVLEEAAGQLVHEMPPHVPGFEVLEEIAPGAGGMGRVYRARELSLDRLVAIKTTRARFDTAGGRAFFEREARAAARLDHPHIVRIHSFHPDSRPPCYVMQFVEGRSLREACRGRGPRYVAAVMEKVARALDHAHGKRIVHRDIKPANILVDLDDEPHITDFGLAGYLDVLLDDDSMLDAASPRGTPHFIAPELFAGNSAGPATDIYALGVTLYNLLTGGHPHAAETFDELREAVTNDEPRLPQEVDPAVPEPLQRICLKAMERDPARRYDSARVLADDLRRFLDGREVFARPTLYQRDRAGKFEDHIAAIDSWRRQSLLDVREADRLVAPYRRILESDSPWDELSRRFPWETISLRVGGWLVLLSCILWPRFYWEQLGRPERVLSVGLPVLGLTLAGWSYLRRGSRVNAIVFLMTACLLLPLFLGILLTEYDLWRGLPSAERELFGDSVLVKPSPHTAADGSLMRPSFRPTNLQITVSLAGFLLFAAGLLILIRARVFAAWTAIGCYLLYASGLLLSGMMIWLRNEQVGRTLVCYLPACLLFPPLALLVRRLGHRSLAAVFFSLYPAPLVVLLTLLARFGGAEWLGARRDWSATIVQQWLMANGAVYLALAILHSRSRRRIARFWGEAFYLLVPVSLLVPSNVLFASEDTPAFGTLGGAPVGLYEYATLLLSGLLVVLGTRLRRQALALGGVVGLGICVLRTTERHFSEVLYWPLLLALVGAAAMLGGGVVAFLRARRAP